MARLSTFYPSDTRSTPFQAPHRHGLITGATGTGKTITLQTLAENLSKAGVPVFMADVKGDLTGISQTGTVPPKLASIPAERGLDKPEPLACPTPLWDVFGEQGHPVRATVSDMGLPLDPKDPARRAPARGRQPQPAHHRVRQHQRGQCERHPARPAADREQGGDKFFGEPMLNIGDFMQTQDVNVAPTSPPTS